MCLVPNILGVMLVSLVTLLESLDGNIIENVENGEFLTLALLSCELRHLSGKYFQPKYCAIGFIYFSLLSFLKKLKLIMAYGKGNIVDN